MGDTMPKRTISEGYSERNNAKIQTLFPQDQNNQTQRNNRSKSRMGGYRVIKVSDETLKFYKALKTHYGYESDDDFILDLLFHFDRNYIPRLLKLALKELETQSKMLKELQKEVLSCLRKTRMRQ